MGTYAEEYILFFKKELCFLLLSMYMCVFICLFVCLFAFSVHSAHHVDTRSLDRLGVYIPRGDASRVFVNSAGTIPPSPAIYGKYNKLYCH